MILAEKFSSGRFSHEDISHHPALCYQGITHKTQQLQIPSSFRLMKCLTRYGYDLNFHASPLDSTDIHEMTIRLSNYHNCTCNFGVTAQDKEESDAG